MILRHRIPNILTCLIMLLFGLQIPNVSQIMLLLLMGIVFLTWSGSFYKESFYLILLLSSFIISFYLIVVDFGFVDKDQAVRRCVIIISSYVLGCSLLPEKNIDKMFLLVSLSAGFVIVSFLAVANATTSQILFSQFRVGVALPWSGGGNIVAGPTLGMFSNLGVCLFPGLFFISRLKNTYFVKLFLFVIIASLFLIGCYVNLVLQNRSFLVVFILSLILSACVFMFENGVTPRAVRRFLLVGFALLLSVCVLGYFGSFFQRLGVFNRIAISGVDTPRYEKWKIMLENLPSNLWGGRTIYVGSNDYAHNFWLDISWDAGLIPFLLIVTFHAYHFRSFLMVMFSSVEFTVKILIICIFCSLLVAFVGEPVLQGSYILFSISCFFLGFISRLHCFINHKDMSASCSDEA